MSLAIERGGGGSSPFPQREDGQKFKPIVVGHLLKGIIYVENTVSLLSHWRAKCY